MFVLETPIERDESTGDPLPAFHSVVTAITFADDGKSLVRRPLGEVSRSPRGGVRGVVNKEGTVFVQSNETDGDFDAIVSVLRPSAPKPVPLVEHAVSGSLPLLVAGHVVVETGREGRPTSGEMRVDDLALVAVPETGGTPRVLLREDALALHLVGTSTLSGVPEESQKAGRPTSAAEPHQAGRPPSAVVLVYEVKAESSAIVVLDFASGKVLSRWPVPPFARDFSVRGETLTFAAARPTSGTGAACTTPFTVESLDWVHGTFKTLHEECGFQPAPFPLGGAVEWVALRGESYEQASLANGALTFGPLLHAEHPIGQQLFEATVASDPSERFSVVTHPTSSGDFLDVVDPQNARQARSLLRPGEGSAMEIIGFAGGEVVR